MGRGREIELDDRLEVRLRSSEKRRLQELAAQLDRTMSDVARDAIQGQINAVVARGLNRATLVESLVRDGHAVVDLAETRPCTQ